MTTYREREVQNQARDFVTMALAILQRDGVIGQDEDMNPQVSAYVGNVCTITPSGKYYTAFAASNVDTCELCAGTGRIPNPNYDPDIFVMAEECQIDLSARLTKCQCSGEQAIESDLYTNLNVAFTAVVLTKHRTAKTMMCPHCGGHGSRDVYLDEVFWAEVDRLCAANNVIITNGEGSATDVFIARQIEQNKVTDAPSELDRCHCNGKCDHCTCKEHAT
jgi:hypothetical protein